MQLTKLFSFPGCVLFFKRHIPRDFLSDGSFHTTCLYSDKTDLFDLQTLEEGSLQFHSMRVIDFEVRSNSHVKYILTLSFNKLFIGI